MHDICMTGPGMWTVPRCSNAVTKLSTPDDSDCLKRRLEHEMLIVEGLTCRFGTKAAVDNASFSVAPGGFVGVIGRSGAGKSTLLRTINCLNAGKLRTYPVQRDGGDRAKGTGAAPLARSLGHDFPTVQPDRPSRCLDQCVDGPAFGNFDLAVGAAALAGGRPCGCDVGA